MEHVLLLLDEISLMDSNFNWNRLPVHARYFYWSISVFLDWDNSFIGTYGFIHTMVLLRLASSPASVLRGHCDQCVR